MYKCPFPGCTHIAAYAILNSHAKTHGYNKVAEMTKEHGRVDKLHQDPKGLFHAKQQSADVRESSYNNIESAMARLVKKDRTELKNRRD